MARKSWRLAILLLAGWPAPVRGEALVIAVDCPSWPAETASQVEARIRAALLVEATQVKHVAVACSSDSTITVRVESEQGAVTLPVLLRSPLVEDDVVAATEAALRELQPPAELPAATPEPPPVSPPPASASPPPPPPPPKRRARPPQSPPKPPSLATDLELGATAELWKNHPALGGGAEMLFGRPQLQWGLGLGARAALGEPSTFALHELDARACAALTLPQLLGLRVLLGVGASLLVATPAREVTASSGTSLATASFELKLERPFWLGAWSIAPGVSGRLFSASRNVRVNEREELVLPLLVPRVGVSLGYRLQ